MYALFTLGHENKIKLLEQKCTIEEIRAVRSLYNENYPESYPFDKTWIMESFANDFITNSTKPFPDSMVQIICWRKIDV
jgi:hypothetical protein